jgi:hypothetical protein
MQNRYVADVGDYGKYALLRELSRTDNGYSICMGVVWCLFPDETFNNDGKHITYLRNPEFAELDTRLFDALKALVDEGRRHVSAIAESGCLPSSTVFYSEPITYGESAAERVRYREAWVRACLKSIQGCELVFFDPDNGLETRSVPKHHPKAGKYIYWDEISEFWNRGKTLLIYHHLNRTASSSDQVQTLSRRFKTALPGAEVVPLVFRRGSSRVFWLIHRADKLGRELEERTVNFVTRWSRHFHPSGWPMPQTNARTI